MTEATMGGGLAKEHVLCTLPFEEPKEAIERLKKRFPDAKVTYRNVAHTEDKAQLEKEIPKGEAGSCHLLWCIQLTLNFIRAMEGCHSSRNAFYPSTSAVRCANA